MKKIFIVLVLALMSINVVSAAQQKQKANSVSNTEKVVDPKTDTNPKVGIIKMTKDSVNYEVYQGPRGGKYIYWITVSGENKGKLKKRSLTKKEQLRIHYNKK